MLSWSLGTLSLSLTLIMAICAAYLMIMVFRYAGLWWGLLFVATPVAYAGLSRFMGPAIAGLLIGLAEVAPVRKFWKDVGRIYVYQLICWAGVLGVMTRTDGWRVALLPPQTGAPAQVVQASD